jgi:Holliday junction resolvasome RuvABC endonuclease subunit
MFRGRLREVVLAYPDLDDVVYEEVVRHAATYAAQMYGAFQGALMTWCHDAFCSFRGVPVGTLKKWATGKGNAKKAEMIEAARDHTGLDITDDNEADAVLLALYAAEHD